MLEQPARCPQSGDTVLDSHSCARPAGLLMALMLGAALSGCSGLPTALTQSLAAARTDDGPVLFAHSDPTPHTIPAVSSNGWSPTPWPPQTPTPEPTRAVRAAQDEAPVAAMGLTVFFDNDADTLTAAELARLSEFFEGLPQPMAAHYVLAGHTDSNHSATYNQGLSQRRTMTVARWLAARGVPEAQLRLTAFGLTQPQADNQTEQGRALNRRVRIDVHTQAR